MFSTAVSAAGPWRFPIPRDQFESSGEGNQMRFCCLILICLGLCTFCYAKESTDKPYAGSTQPPLAPAEAQKRFKVPDGFEVRLFAAEPDVANPVAMTFDEKGRLWVVELYEYP